MYYFIYSIGNLSTSQLIFASVRLLMIRRRKTIEGEIIPHQIYDMELTHHRSDELFFPRPTIIEHIINSRSPLYGIQKSALEKEHFEIVAIIEGIFDHTGFSCHFRTSYLPSELLWGYQFSSCNSTLSGFDYLGFNDVQPIDVHPCWNVQDEEFNVGTDASTGSSYLYDKSSTVTNSTGRLERPISFDDTYPPNKRYKRFRIVESNIQ